MRPRTLVIAFNFPPFADASAVTVAKRIVEQGSPVDVVCQDMSGLRSRDPSLSSLVAPYVQERHVLTGTPRFLDWTSISAFARSGLRRITTQGPLSRYGSVYSRSMWPHSHVLAAAVAVASPGTLWRAEFSDPLLRHVDGQPRHSPPLNDDSLTHELIGSLPLIYQRWVRRGGELLHLIQALPFALATELVFTNEQQRTVMLADLEDDALAESVLARSIISPHPVPPDDWIATATNSLPVLSQPDRGLVSVGYFGTLYPNRGLGMLIEAVRLLSPDERDLLRVDVYADQRAKLSSQIRQARVHDIIHVGGALPYLQFLSTAMGYDALLVLDTQGGDFPVANPFLPSKVSDYVATGRPILAVTSPGSELDKRAYPLSVRVGDVAGLRDSLSSLITRRST